jgi:hypothetical protein
MDPNEALRHIRNIVMLHETSDLHDPLEAMNSLVGYVQALDDWLSRGGFLPEAWNLEEV